MTEPADHDRRVTRAFADRAARRMAWSALTAGVVASVTFVGTRIFAEDLGWVVALLLGVLAWCGWLAAWLRTRGPERLLIAATALLIATGTGLGTLVGWGTVTSWFAAAAPTFGVVLAAALRCGAERRGEARRDGARLRHVAGTIVWPLLVGSIALGALVSWHAAHVPARVALDPADLPPPARSLGPVPDLERIDGALRLADGFIAGLYVADGIDAGPRHYPVMSEFYALPIRVRPSSQRGWRLLGRRGNSAREIARGPTSETSLVAFDLRGTRAATRFVLMADIDWNYRPGAFRVRLRLVSAPTPREPVHVQIGQTDVGAWGAHDSGVEHIVVLPVAERRRLQSTRYTIRHATISGYWWLRYHGDRRAAAMRDTVTLAGLDPDRDLYSPMWWGRRESPTRGAVPRDVDEDMVFSADIYRDCRHVQPASALHVQYRSKVCRVPLDAYRWLSFSDPEAEAAQALQIAQQRGPDARYRDLDLRRRTPREAAQRLERQVGATGWLGLSRCHPLGCETGWVTSTRTWLFGALEAELGYGAGDVTSRGYADLAARIALRVQIPASGVATAERARLYRPLQIGGFYTAWGPGWRGGSVSSGQTEAIDAVEQRFDMPSEYDGNIASNAETTLAAYAFLVRYRCLRYAVGCDRATSPIASVALRPVAPAQARRVGRFAPVGAVEPGPGDDAAGDGRG